MSSKTMKALFIMIDQMKVIDLVFKYILIILILLAK